MLIIHTKEPSVQALGCVIWMHGLGANAADMMDLAHQLPFASLPLQHVFVEAPVRPITLNNGIRMQAWYDITGFKLSDKEDRKGILQSQTQITEVIEAQITAGFRANQIFLAGFSQGGAIALYTALHCGFPLAGVVALSSYLPLALECKPVLAKHTPIFIAGGQYDPIVLPNWTKLSEQWLLAQGYHQLCCYDYPMEHSICLEELYDLANWLTKNVSGVMPR